MTSGYNRQSVFRTPWFELVSKDYGTGELPHYVMEVPDYVSVIARNKAGMIILVQQHRQALDISTIEFPSGHVDQGESPLESGRRELLEETAYHGGHWTQLTSLHSDVGRICNQSHTFFADQVESAPGTQAEEGIKVIEISPSELVDLAIKGGFSHSIHVASLFLAREKKLL